MLQARSPEPSNGEQPHAASTKPRAPEGVRVSWLLNARVAWRKCALRDRGPTHPEGGEHTPSPRSPKAPTAAGP
eukprot:5802624-Alexandrium_andersonii.AAC.1